MAKKPTTKPAAKKAKPAQRTFDDLLSTHPDELQERCRRLKQLVLDTLSAATEGIYGGSKVGLALYAVDGKVLCGIQPAKEKCLFYLHYVKAEDSPSLKLEGQGTHALHIKIETTDAATLAELTRLLQLAHTRSMA